MVFCIITAKQQNWQRFSGPPPDTDTKSTLRDSKLIEKRIDFDTRVAFAEGEADMSRYLLFEEVEGHGEGYMWPNVRTALAGTWLMSINILAELAYQGCITLAEIKPWPACFPHMIEGSVTSTDTATDTASV
ncbi:hypothetical protein C8R48DRAFT_775961 [Suillus tomentosus]|nr:hypothetical protein C8R48DRAFT_775961 [Suillus tomentosus]